MGNAPFSQPGELKPGFGKWAWAILFPFFLHWVSPQHGAAKKKRQHLFQDYFTLIHLETKVGLWASVSATSLATHHLGTEFLKRAVSECDLLRDCGG